MRGFTPHLLRDNTQVNLKHTRKGAGFTLIELLIVIAIIAIIAAVVFVALDPLTRFQDARDSSRWSDTSAILNAIKVDQVDNGGSYLAAIGEMASDSFYMIVDGAMDAGCDDNDINCDVNVGADTRCVNLADLVTEGYLGDVPISPAGSVTWDDGSEDGKEGTGYVLKRHATGIITVQACESENTTEIMVAR